ncbi:MAG: hypothetical protein A3I67_01845 [Chlamydiae bacterium RIFCSPLOWO2_02_FULL_45_22]|nr:MAG: hypothetical protein A3I67_01845 [Chlamydiae bacterium RIFCSPLOWO2_02_FULL_45_22]
MLGGREDLEWPNPFTEAIVAVGGICIVYKMCGWIDNLPPETVLTIAAISVVATYAIALTAAQNIWPFNEAPPPFIALIDR